MSQKSINVVLDNVEKVIIGKRDVVELCMVALLAKGHVLLEDVPGVGKTMLVKALARSIDVSYKRIQFTPDLLPSDVVGVSIFNPKDQEFHFRPGPIMGNIILADEINRSSPKTQSALLEAMEEEEVTIDGMTYELVPPFLVMATQNPIEHEGTYALPEAQIDRFLLKIKMGYPERADELLVLQNAKNSEPLETLTAVLSKEEIVTMQAEMQKVIVDDGIARYILELVTRTRNDKRLVLGVSPRGSIALMKAAQALAYVRGRDFVLPDDVQYVAPFVLAHRILLTTETTYRQVTTLAIIEELLQKTPVPIKREDKK